MAITSTMFFTILLIGLTTFLVLLRKRRKYSDGVHLLAAPEGSHWLWGHEKELFDGSQPEVYNAWTDRFGGAYRIDGALWYGDILVATDPEIITHIFTHNVYKYAKSPYFRPLIERLFGRSIIWAEGDDHKRMAKVLSGYFRPERVRGMHEAAVESAQRLSSLLRSHLLDEMKRDPAVADSGVTMNIVGWPSRATLDIIGRVGFDYDFKCGESPDAKDIFRLWNKQCNMGITFAGFIAPLLFRALPILNSILPGKIIEAQSATKMHIRRLAMGLARDAIEEAYSNDNDSKTRLLRRKNLLSDLVQISVHDGVRVNVDELLDHIATFVMAGHETSAGVVGYILHALCQDQKRQDKLRAESSAAGFCATSGIQGKEPTYDELMGPKTLPYLDAVVKEGLRLFPIASNTERVALEDDVIPLKTPVLAADGKTVLNSIRVRKGQMISISWLSVNTNSRTWGPDSMTFKPERWLAAAADPQNSALPRAVSGGFQNMGSFSEGPRMCLGYRLALLAVKAIIFTLVRDFWFDAVDRVPVLDAETKQPTGEMMEVEVEKAFSAILLPHIKNGERAGMSGVWLPVRICPMEGTH